MENRATVINLFGGPSVGKSTTAAGVFSILKLHGVECELVTEFAKDLTWEERYNTLKNQQYIFGKQHHRLWRIKDKVDIIVTDSPLMLSSVYGEVHNATTDSFTTNVIDVVNTFNNYNILLTRTKKYNQNGRSQSEGAAKKIDKLIIDKLSKHNMEWLEAPGNFEGINKIAGIFLEDKQKFKIGPTL